MVNSGNLTLKCNQYDIHRGNYDEYKKSEEKICKGGNFEQKEKFGANLSAEWLD
jgi:hypothetical protein